jgi:hypothetical protein
VYEDQIQYNNVAQVYNEKVKSNKNYNYWISKYITEVYPELRIQKSTQQTYTSRYRRFGIWLKFKKLGAGTPLGQYYDTNFEPVYADYLQKYVLWNNPTTRTPDVTKDFMNAEKALKKAFRQMYTSLLKSNPLVTDHDLVDMDLPPHPSGEQHFSHLATDYQDFKMLTNVIRQIIVAFFDNANEERAKPAGQHGAEILWAILDAPPRSGVSSRTHRSTQTHRCLCLLRVTTAAR